MALLSRVGLADVVRGFAGEPGFPDPEARAIGATCGGVRVWSVYVPNGRTPDDPHYAYKLAWLAALRDALADELAGAPPLVVCGDFNVAPDRRRRVGPGGVRRLDPRHAGRAGGAGRAARARAARRRARRR